ncbi:MAG: trehalose-phosphatase, partial [Phycisphaerales bacterium]|nr:trehalose-phosphatase [Phycisphaerales bacterium]
MNGDVERLIGAMARTPVLLVASDFDGTLAPIVIDAASAAATPAALEALRRLESLPHTHVAVVSGRGLADLRSRVPVMRTLTLAGSHGAELDGVRPPPIPDATQEQMSNLAARLRAEAAGVAGLLVEAKPRAIALHYRGAAAQEVEGVLSRVRAMGAEFPGL